MSARANELSGSLGSLGAPGRGAGEAAALFELADVAGLAGHGRQTILVVYEHVPDPDTSGADLRLFQIVEILAAAGHALVLVGRTPRDDTRARGRLAALGVEVLAPDPERIFWEPVEAPSIELERRLAQSRFDVALLYGYFWVGLSVAEQYQDLVRRCSPATRILLLSDDCHWLREERRAVEEHSRTVLERSRGLRAKELDSYRRADLVLTITEDDRARMRAAAPELDPIVVSFGQEEIPARVAGFEERRGLLFLGSGANDANRKAIEWFVAEILPLVRRAIPAIELALVGEPPAGGWGFDAPDGPGGVVTLGRVADLEPCFARARVFVSPVTYGTGLKTKNVQALGRGLPIVATSISVEGMHLSGDGAAHVRDDAASFAAAVVALHEDGARWEASSKAALAHARAWFGRERVIRDLVRVWRVAFERAPKPIDAERIAPADLAGRFFPERIASKRLAQRYAAHVELARELRALGRTDEAEQELRNVFCELCCFPSDSPVFAEPHALLATLYMARAAYADAAAAAEEALRLDPHLDEALRASLARVAEVARAKQRQGQGGTDLIDGWIAEAHVAFECGEAQRALELCARVLDRDPRHVETWNDLGVIFHALGEPEEALFAFDRALAHAPEHRAARSNRARVHSAGGRNAEALLDVEALLARDPQDVEALALHAEIAAVPSGARG